MSDFKKLKKEIRRSTYIYLAFWGSAIVLYHVGIVIRRLLEL